MKSSLLLVVLAGLSLAQNPAERQGVDVARVGVRLACLCGACNATLANCPMLECHSGKPGKEKIFRMQQAGISDQAIIDDFVKEFGSGILRAAPSVYGRLIPYLALIPGLGLVLWFIRRYYRPRLAPASPDPSLARYQTQIEKDLSQLD
ncbi:MAG: hypothetical protein WD696_16830 [Bryobacteraceae bacterium]